MASITTKLANVNEAYLPMIESQMTMANIHFTEYSRICVLNALSAINAMLDKAGVSWASPELDKSNVTDVLLKIAALQLNASASPREIYFQMRNVRQKNEGKDKWVKQIELGIEGDGNDALLARFGRDVAEVRQYWAVRDGDGFKYPKFTGLNMSPPEWEPHGGDGKIVRVVYPIIRKTVTSGKESFLVEYHISERADVMKNLLAHIKQNLMDETFGLAESRFKADDKALAAIADKKREIIDKAEALGLDGALDCKELWQYISPAWTEPHSRENMILRKMRNNAIKKIPKDFSNGTLAVMYEEATDDVYAASAKEARDKAAAIPADFPDEQPAPDEITPEQINADTGEVVEPEKQTAQDEINAVQDDFEAEF